MLYCRVVTQLAEPCDR